MAKDILANVSCSFARALFEPFFCGPFTHTFLVPPLCTPYGSNMTQRDSDIPAKMSCIFVPPSGLCTPFARLICDSTQYGRHGTQDILAEMPYPKKIGFNQNVKGHRTK